jgi:tricorn protease
LWKTGAHGGKAQRLTTHPASETHAAISHDGKFVAFSASYEGAQEAYVMPVEGGLPKRITFENGGVTVLGWTAQGEVLVSTENSVKGPSAHRVVAALEPLKLARRVLPLPTPTTPCWTTPAARVYFTRMGLALTNDNVKSYRGGAHAQLWRFDLSGESEAEPLFKGDDANNRAPCGGRAACTSSATAAAPTTSGRSLPDGSDRRQLTTTRNGTCAPPRWATAASPTSWAPTCACSTSPAAGQQLNASLVSDFDQQRTRRVKSPLDPDRHRGRQQARTHRADRARTRDGCRHRQPSAASRSRCRKARVPAAPCSATTTNGSMRSSTPAARTRSGATPPTVPATASA